MINLNKKKGINPFIDRILNNPLSFIQSSSIEPVKELESDKLIVLSKKQKLNSHHPSPKKVKKEDKKRPKTMAEAVAAYTGKKYGIDNSKKRKRVELSDSEDEDQGEEIVGDNAVDHNVATFQPQDDDDLGEDVGEIDERDDEDEEFESANEYQSSSDSDYKSDSKEKSESESILSEEPEDLQKLKEDLRKDDAESLPTKDQSTLTPKSPVKEPMDELSNNEEIPESDSEQEQINLDNYYQINDLPLDRGSNGSKRINKSWRKKYLNRKSIGLLNQGVTCYMNTAIQSMVHIPAIANYLDDIYNGKYNEIISNKSVSYTLSELNQRLWNERRKYIHPKKVINRLEDINCMMSEWQQEDSHEYFMSLMSRLQEDSTPKGVKLNKSVIYDIFGGLLNQIVICENCKHKSITKQEFYDLSLGFNKRKKSKFNIERSIEEFFNNELIKLDKEDKKSGYYCENCKLNANATKQNTIDQAPEVLAIHLKRFKFNGSQSLKVKQSIKYSNYINLSPYATNDNDKDNYVYKLISIISHEGRSISSGHYVAHCLQPDQTWSTYDDEYINKISEAQALNDPSAYVLVYSKLTPKTNDQNNA